MSLTPPPGRTLPDPDRLLSRVLGEGDDRPGAGTGAGSPANRPRWVVALGALAAAGVVGVTVLGMSVLRQVDGDALTRPSGGTSSLPAATAATSASTQITSTASVSEPLLVGPLTAEETRSITEACTRQFRVAARSTAHERSVEIGGAFPARFLTVVVTAADGTVWGCSAPEEDPQSVTGGDITSQTRPRTGSRVMLGMASTMRGTGSIINFIEASGWAVLPKGATAARVRWLVNGVAHPWRTAVPVGGLAFLVVHLDAAVSAGDVLVAQAQLLDASGRVLEDTRDIRSEVVQRDGRVTLEGVR